MKLQKVLKDLVAAVIPPVASVVILLFGGCSGILRTPTTHEAVTPDEFGKKFSTSELRDDLHFLLTTLEDVHPNLHAALSKVETDSIVQRVEQELGAPMTRLDFYFRVAPLVAAIQDGHTNVAPPWEEFSHYMSGGGLTFPFAVAYDTASGLTITRSYAADSTLSTGDRIVSINGLAADSLVATYLHAFAGERMPFRYRRAAASLRLLLWAQNIQSPYDLVVTRAIDRHVGSPHVIGAGWQDIRRIDSLIERGKVNLPPYRFERMGNNIGYIDFRSMTNLDQFDEFLRTTFSEIRSRPVDGLIIDLRNNGGGDSRLGSALLSYVADSAYRMVARKEWKMSAEYKGYLRHMIPWWIRWFPFTWVSAEARKYFSADDGEIVIDSSEVEYPEPNSLRYHGRICLLIGAGTFSSAMMLANAVSDYKLAVLIGEETGGIPTAFGEVYQFDLPNTRLSVGASSAFFVRANGDATSRRGVLPDIECRQTQDDRRLGRDTVLERARVWISGGK